MTAQSLDRNAVHAALRDATVLAILKGERHAPESPESAALVRLLDRYLPSYKVLNILAEPRVHAWLHELGHPCEAPCLFVKGTLVGGIAEARALEAEGQLAPLLNARKYGPGRLPTLSVTPAARAALREYLSPEAGVLRFALDREFRAELWLGDKEETDLVVTAEGLAFHLDPSTAERCNGTQFDFVAGPSGKGFRIEVPDAPPRVRALRVTELKEWMARGDDFVLLDVRTEQEREHCFIEDSRLYDQACRTWLETVPRDRPLVFQCHHGVRSAVAAEHALRQGFRKVYNLVGGIEAWSLEVDPKVPRY